jgi:universal stress protein E
MVPEPVSDVPMNSRRDILESATRHRLERLKELARDVGLRGTKCAVHWDYPIYEAIVRHVLEIKPDLLVTDSHRYGRLARLVLANTDWELIRSCPCPLWFVRSPKLPARPRVLVAVDPRHSHEKPARLDDRLLGAADLLVDQLDAQVRAVHAYEAPMSALPGMLMEPIRLPISPQHTRDFIEKTTQSVHKLCGRHGVDEAHCLVREGATRDVIVAAAREADVLVMGAVSRSMLARPVIGSTAESVIDHVSCDLLIFKPAGFKSPVKRSTLEMEYA